MYEKIVFLHKAHFLLLFCVVICISIHLARKKINKELDEMMNHELYTRYHAQTD
jgi:hypothetical protein